MPAVGCCDQLRGDADAVPCSADAALEDVSHIQHFGDPSDVFLLALERERRRAGNYLQIADVRKRVDDFLGQTVAEVFVLLVGAHVDERQHGDRWLLVNRLR